MPNEQVSSTSYRNLPRKIAPSRAMNGRARHKKCRYPAPAKLRAHLAAAAPTSFCGCGCNSFDVATDKTAPPLSPPGNAGMAFETAFQLLHSDRSVEIHCNWNNQPASHPPYLETEPYYVWAHASLLGDI